MSEKITFPTTELLKIGRTTYRVTAHFNEDHDKLKPKIEKLLKKELESGYFDNGHSQ